MCVIDYYYYYICGRRNFLFSNNLLGERSLIRYTDCPVNYEFVYRNVKCIDERVINTTMYLLNKQKNEID